MSSFETKNPSTTYLTDETARVPLVEHSGGVSHSSCLSVILHISRHLSQDPGPVHVVIVHDLQVNLILAMDSNVII